MFYDFGIGIGGNLVDLLTRLLGSVKQGLAYLSDNKSSFSFHQQTFMAIERKPAIEVVDVKTIKHYGLINYLASRKISISTARSLCKEVHFILNGKKYFSIGLENISGGWELRNKYFKSGSSPKDISLIKNGYQSLVVTEGMFDMLSLFSMDNSLSKKADLLVLNSCSFSDRLTDYKDTYDKIFLYLDHDRTGRTITNKCINEQTNFYDNSNIYSGFNDLNEWWVKENKL